MNLWIVRGIGMAFVHVATRVVLGIAIAAWPLHGSLMRWLGILVVVLAVVLWAGVDGIRDARAHPSEREETDLTMVWLKAGAVAGLLSGAACWLIGTLSDISLGENSLFFELTSGAAFTLLLVFVPAMVAVAVGRFIGHRDPVTSEDSDIPTEVAVPVAAGVAAAGGEGPAGLAWSHETEREEFGAGYGFAEGPYADKNVSPDNDSTDNHSTDNRSTSGDSGWEIPQDPPTEVIRAAEDPAAKDPKD